MESFLQKKAVRRFASRFLLVFIISQLVLITISVYPLQTWLAENVSALTHIPNNGIFLDAGSGTFEITPFCAGITSIALMAGLLFGFNYPKVNQKIVLFAIGGIGLFILNILRIALVVWVGKSTQNLSFAENLHTLTWFAMSGIILGAWYWALKHISHAKNHIALARLLMNGRPKYRVMPRPALPLRP